MSEDKEQLLKEIEALETARNQSLDDYTSKQDEINAIKKNGEKIKTAFEEIKKQYDETFRDLRYKEFEFNQIKAQGKNQREQLDSLKRKLDRLSDSERLQNEYNAQLNEFKEKCLTAPWRKENREDGKGAFEHQIEGAINLAIAGQALLGDKRGLGKTLTQLIWQDFIEAEKVIVVVPNDTMENFMREVRHWAPHRAIIPLGRWPKAQRDFMLANIKEMPQFIIVLNYEAWRRDTALIEDLIQLHADTLVLDEAHKAKTWTTATCKGIINLRFGLNCCPECNNTHIDKFEYSTNDKNYAQCLACSHEGFVTEFCSIKSVLPMTGTPIHNRPQELFPLARLIDPGNFISEKQYLYDFCYKGSDQHWRWRDGAEKDVVKILGKRYLARNRKDAGIIIPPAQPVDHFLTKEEMKENYPLQFEAYEQVRKYGQIVLDPDRKIAMSMPIFLAVLLRLRQVLVWPAALELKYKDDEGIEQLVAQLNVQESIKLDKAEEIITEVFEEGDRSLLFSMFKPGLRVLQSRLEKKGIRVAIYDGDTPKWQKNQIELDFDPKTADPEHYKWDVCLGNYRSMGEGLNLNAANQMVLLDRYWNPAGEDQAVGRIDRIGTTKDTTVHRIMIEGTVDTWMEALIAQKAEIVGGFESQAKQWRDAYDALLKGEL